MKTFFLDTSAVVKHYRPEKGTEHIDALFDDAANSLYISELTLVEFISALQRLESSGEMDEETLNEAWGKFESDARVRFVIIDLNRALIVQAKSIVQKHGLRTLDALHLASVLSIQVKSPVLVSADTNLIQAAQANGLQTLNPLD